MLSIQLLKFEDKFQLGFLILYLSVNVQYIYVGYFIVRPPVYKLMTRGVGGYGSNSDVGIDAVNTGNGDDDSNNNVNV